MTNKEALKAWEEVYAEIDKENWLFVGTINPEMVSLAIKALKERPQGEWVGNNFNEHACNKCGHYALYEEEADGQYYEVRSDFCPNCGAKMEDGVAMSTNMLSHRCYTISRNKTTCDVCGAKLKEKTDE